MGCELKANSKLKASIENQFANFSPEILMLKLSKPALRALVLDELWTLNQIHERGEKYISSLHGIGKTAIRKLFK